MIAELDTLTDLGAEMTRRADAAGVSLIWRAQVRSTRSVLVRNGKAENSSAASVAGHGVQVLTDAGHSALASRDDFRPEPALKLLQRAIDTAGHGPDLQLKADVTDTLAPTRGRSVPEGIDALLSVELDGVASRLAEFEREICAAVPGTSVRISFRAELDAWRIFRSDGTDVLFAMPRCAVGVRATSANNGSTHGVSASIASPGPDMLWDDAKVAVLTSRALSAARLARDLPDAPAHEAGSFPLVIDYALAKGLAHEAFGHASEADSFRSSVLARDGRFRVGDTVGASHVSIIDEPVEGDHAWQPYSANGLRRDRALIVDHGRLADALSDPWSANAGGVRVTGAARAESFRHAPQPRMTNIRIEVDHPLPAPGPFEDYGPEQVRDLLDNAGVFSRHPSVCFLSGYSGGQVNPTSGDFVFNCKAIYRLSRGGVVLHKPAIFSGSMFGALNRVREAFGPLKLDAIGYCGKWGQSVPSSGGSHYFLVLDPDPTVRLGGR
jgi:TldD protein